MMPPTWRDYAALGRAGACHAQPFARAGARPQSALLCALGRPTRLRTAPPPPPRLSPRRLVQFFTFLLIVPGGLTVSYIAYAWPMSKWVAPK